MSFLRRHHQWVTFIGAFFVFTTFVAKDYLRDNAKDDLTDITNAKSAYTERIHYDEVLRAIRNVSDGLRFDDVSGSESSFGDPTTINDLRLSTGPLSEDHYELLLEQTELLSEKLKNEPEVQAARNSAIAATEKLLPEKVKVDQILYGDVPPPAKAPASKEQIQAADELLAMDDQADKTVESYHALAVKRADERQALEEKRYRQFSHWTWLFFALGWLVTLGGKMLEQAEAPEVEA